MDQRWAYQKISACPVAADDFEFAVRSALGLKKL